MLFRVFSILALEAILYGGVEPFGQFGIGPYEEHLSETILKLGQQLRRCGLKVFF